ncbi:LamG-like jellyroll fold domain-containing protein [Methanococcoides burtonii]|uniref:Protein with DUF1628 and Laminin G domains n=1 Tax=Methanococcoides burtonii (strain DSM 6242 / NBRC 107633 / OCM 468 / ACE-M) TaxID=259564 RepID=Q12UM1_METBU|nr:LamG-like jellyroll fold domain-containing protein [Methanococcoides burtonii]ABE52855.1 protein with DUF1628 and Laminin G domains [Methanococcoides burtonii DSM 6242]
MVPLSPKRSFIKNTDGVSVVVGEIMMTAIVVIAVSFIAASVLSYEGPSDVPNVDVIGWVDVGADTVNFRHTGGETVDGQDIRLNLNLNGSAIKLSSQEIQSIYGKPQWELGDIISINASSLWGLNISDDDYVSSALVHTPSNIVIMSGPLLGDEISSGGSLGSLPQVLISSGWPFNENGGTIAYDAVNDNDGTLTGVDWVSGISGSGIRFHDDSDVVRVENSISLNPKSEITLEAWVKWAIDPNDGENWANILNKDGEDQYQLQHTYGNNRFEFAVNTDDGRDWISSTTAPQKEIWYHVVGVYSSYDQEIAIYVNGVKERSAVHEGDIAISSAPFLIGEHLISDRSFNGIIDEVWVYNTRLTDEQIKARHDLNKPTVINSAYWTFNEDSGTVAYDSIGDHDGDVMGATWVSGLNDSALEFDGSNDHVSVDSSIIENYPFSVSAWIKNSGSNKDEVIISMADSSATNAYYGMYLDKTKGLTIAAKNTALKEVSSTVDVTDGNWHYVVGVFASAIDRKLYVDGVLNGTDTRTVPFNSDFDRWNIGRWADKTPSAYFNGVIDEASITDRELSASEIMNNYLQLKPQEVTIPVTTFTSFWAFNEGTGINVVDSMGGNDGTLKSGASWVSGVNGTALSLDDRTEYVVVNDNSSLDLSTEGSIDTWIKLNSHIANAGIVHKGDRKSKSDKAYSLEFDNDEHVSLVLYNSSGSFQQVTSVTKLELDKWYHLTGTWNSSSIEVYINGILDRSEQNTIGAVRNTDGTLQIGAKITQNDGANKKYGLDGTIDEVYLSNKKMTLFDIRSRYEMNKQDEISEGTYASQIIFNKPNKGGVIKDGGYISFTNGNDHRHVRIDGTKYDLETGDSVKLEVVNDQTSATISMNDVSSQISDFDLNVKLYINGDLKDTGRVTSIYANPMSDFSSTLKYELPSHNSQSYLKADEITIIDWHPVNDSGIIISNIGFYSSAGTVLTLTPSRTYLKSSGYYQLVTNDPVMSSFWTFNENSGTTVHDSISNLNGDVEGAAWTTGSNGSGLDFDGTNDHVFVPNSSDFKFTDSITMMAWVNSDVSNTAKIVQKGDWGGYGLGLDIWNGWGASVYFDGSGSQSLRWGSGVPENGRWYHVAFTYDGSAMRLYVDGREVNNATVSGDLKVNSKDIYIGSDGVTQKFFDGKIDEVGVHQNALTGNEIYEIYNSSRPVTTNGTKYVLYKVNSSYNDAEERISNGAMVRTSTDLELVRESTDQEVGVRFTGVAIPQGSTIESATLVFVIDEYESMTTNLNIYAHDADESPKFGSRRHDITRRGKTTQYVQWNSIPAPAVGGILVSPDISDVVQEVIGRPGWSSGNSLSIIINGNGRRTVESYNGVPSSAPLLNITYS